MKSFLACSMRDIPTCKVFGGLRGAAGTSFVKGYDRDRMVLATLHRCDETIALNC